MSIRKMVALVGVLIGVLGVADAQAGPTWRWRDADGGVQFGDRPPPGVAAELVKSKARPPAPSAAEGASTFDAQDESAENQPGADKDRAADRKAQDAAGKLANRRGRCDQARWALAALESGRPVYRDETGAYRIKRAPNQPDGYTGERRYLDATERDSEIAHHQGDMDKYCAEFPELKDKRLAEDDLRHAEACEQAQADLAKLEAPESRVTEDEIARRRQFLEQECWSH